MSQSGSFKIGGGSGAPIDTITGNTGGAVGPDGAGNINILGSGNITTTGNAGTFTETITLTGTTDHAVQVGNASGSLTSLGVGATNTVLVGNTAADPSFGTIPNAALDNSSITLNNGNNITVTGSPVSLGGAATIAVTGTTNHSVLVGRAAGNLGSLAVGSTGLLLVGVTGDDPVFAASAASDFTFTSGVSGDTRTLTVSNSSNSANSAAKILSLVAGATAGDPVFQASTTTTTWTFGIDNSVTSPTVDPFVIAQGTALGTNNVLSIDTAGAINYPLQPAFSAYLSSTVTDVTGDATQYTIIPDTVIYDQGSNYNNATGVFTAPVAGRYLFCCTIFLTDIGAAHTSAQYRGNYSGTPYVFGQFNPFAMSVGTNLSYGSSFFVNMAAGDTISCSIAVSGSTKTVDVLGAANPDTFFSGALIC